MDSLALALEAARAAPSADNSQPWQLLWDGAQLAVHYRPHPGLDPFGLGGHATLISIGALSENLTQALPDICARFGLSDLKGGAPYFVLPLGQESLPDNAAELPLFQRHTNRHPFGQQKPDTALLDDLARLVEPSVRLLPLIAPRDRASFADLAGTCCEARFCNRELHEWLMGSLRFSAAEVARGDGLDLATLHLPPGGKLFMQLIRPWNRMALLNRVGAYRFMAAAEVQLLRQAPLILAVVGPNSPEGSFAAGRLMERAWIRLNQLGWAVHPYYVVADQETRLLSGRLPDAWKAPVAEALSELPALLGLGAGDRLHMALRVGRPTRTPQRSRRLPLEAIFVDTTREA